MAFKKWRSYKTYRYSQIQSLGRPIEDLSIEEKYKNEKMKLLKLKMNLLKKLDMIERRVLKEEVSLFSCEKYEIIKSTIKYKLKI